MDAARLIKELAGGPAIIRALVAGLDAEALGTRPAPDAWSVRDVLCHLLDEERHDFRAMLEATLAGEPWPRNWPGRSEALVLYAGADPGATLDAWETERQRSLEWLASQGDIDWDTPCEAPWGTMRAGDLLASWAAHDTLHQRQIVRLRFLRLQEMAAPYSVAYAGDW